MEDDPLRRRRLVDRLDRGGFETVWPNAAGWSALVGAGLVWGGIVAVVTDVPPAIALPLGVAAAWATALVADHVRWRNRTTGMGYGGLDAASGALVVERLRALGIEAEYRELPVDDEDGGGVQRQIVCRNADADAVRRVIDETLGIAF